MSTRLFGSLRDDPLFTGVVQLTGKVEDVFTGFRIPCKSPILLFQPALHLGCFSLYDYQFSEDDGILMLYASGESWFCAAQGHQDGHLLSILELCAGFGGMGIGASYLGGQVRVSVDFNSLSVEHLKANSHGTVLQLDLTADSTAKLVHQAFGATPGSTTLGFPCQPHSSQGLGLGSADPRFAVFWGGLRILFLTQSQTAILECVTGAGIHPEIRKGLQLLCSAMGLSIHAVNLDLKDQWPCRRHRWWALLLPTTWDVLGLPPWVPSQKFSTVGKILQVWGTWPDSEEEDLRLQDNEIAAFSDPALGADKRHLELGDLANTFLHSYANAMRSCPCSCRSAGFRRTTLEQGGLRGCYVLSNVHGAPRFLHPREVALLLGIPDLIHYPHTPRSSLALLGLVASPLQMIWVYGHLRLNVTKAFDLAPFPAPDVWLQQYCSALLQQTAARFGLHPSPSPLMRIADESWTSLDFVCHRACTVLDFLRAQRITMDWNASGSLQIGDVPLSLSALLHLLPAPALLRQYPGSVERPIPPSQFLVLIIHDGQHHLLQVQGGDFLFQPLRQLGILHCHFLLDDQGQIYGADTRIWRPMKLHTLHPSEWPPRSPGTLQATGSVTSLGLTDLHIWAALETFGFLDLPGLFLLHPLLLNELLHKRSGLPGLLEFQKAEHSTLAGIFAADNHWALLWGQVCPDGLCWTYFDGLPHRLEVFAHQLALDLAIVLGFSSWTFQHASFFRQVHPYTCGTLALLHLCRCLGFSLDFSAPALLDFHHFLLRRTPACPALSLIGLGPTATDAQLAALLATKGVPTPQAADRATAAIKKLGLGPIQQALQQSNPWKSLKQLTTKPGQAFQFVTKEELDAYIAQRAADQHGAHISVRKKKDRSHQPKADSRPRMPDPQHLRIQPGDFVDPESDQVDQIDLDHVIADARGIAICTLSAAQPYIREPKSISADALALLITEEVPGDLKAQANISTIRFPVIYQPTSDPLLIQGSLLQLGDLWVSRKPLNDPVMDMEIAATHVLKVQLYRDELVQQWDALIQSPIKHLITIAPKFRLCTNVHCDHRCGLYHASVEEPMDQVIHEIWGRRFQSIDGKTQPAAQAELFQAFLRIAAPALTELLKIVVDGLYLEPRSDHTRSTDLDYSVIWIPGATRETAYHKLKTTSYGLSLVRMKQRFGIRVCSTYEAAAYAELRPGEDFLKVNVTRIYRLHPLPHGLQRAQIAKILREWHWTAKPLQPSRGTAEGGAWDVGSAEGPPSTIMRAFSKDILISLIKDRTEPDQPLPVLGSRRAQAHLRTQGPSAAASSDPWLSQDPWASFKPTESAKAVPQRRFEELASQLRTDLTATFEQKLQNQPISTSATSTEDAKRLHQLEVGVAELRSHNQQISQWCADTGTRMAAQDELLSQLQGSVVQQQQELQSVRAEVHTSADNLHQAMQRSFSSMKNDLAADFSGAMDNHMARLESMLSKKTRHE
eukprot:s1405_g11.t1